MNHPCLVLVFSFFLISCSYLVNAQQPYIGLLTTACESADNTSSILGYTCNGVSTSCQAYLTFRSQPPYNTVSSISSLLNVDSLLLSQLNSVPRNATFDANKLVLVPLNCTCSGEYYQKNASYVVQPNDSYSSIATKTFQSLSTCKALQAQNSNMSATNLARDARIEVPLRCACVTRNQSNDGMRYLLSYLISPNDTIFMINETFGVGVDRILEANSLSLKDTIYAFSTLLIPLQNPLSISQIREPSSPPPSSSSPPPSSPPQSDPKTWIYVVVGVLGGLAITAVLVFCLFFGKRDKKTELVVGSESSEAVERPLNKKLDEESGEFLESLSSIAQSLKVYSFKEIQSATENFSPSCWIKGSVYRGNFDGDLAAIKKTNGDVSKEITLLSKINHFNLIRLSGICFNDGHWYLVYEYAANGSLSDSIHYTKSGQTPLNWMQRLQIALDVAMGLNYLHSYTSPPHVHKDLNSDNILLDSDFRAKLANFGLARAAEEQEGQFALTRHIVGTKGYMAPEYLENGLISPKLDVYSFGILLLEVLTGNDIAVLYEDVNTHLSEILTPVLHDEEEKENLRSFIDPSLQGMYPAEPAVFIVRLIDSCIQKDPSGRPNMSEIVQSLSRAMTTTPFQE